MYEEIRHAEDGVVRLLTNRDLDNRAVLLHDNTVECKRNRHPLVLLDAAVVVRVEICQTIVLIQGVLLHINTAGVGERPSSRDISCRNMKSGDTLILTGTLGDHHAAVLTNRLGIESGIESDCAPLNHMVEELLEENISVHTVRDITRGGLATVANELAVSSSVRIELEEELIPVSDIVQGFTGILGLDPLTMGNDGKMIIAVSPKDAEKAVGILRRNKYGRNAVAAGQVLEGKGVYLRTALGGLRRVLPLRGEGLPRIC